MRNTPFTEEKALAVRVYHTSITAQFHMHSLLSTTCTHCSVPHVLTAQFHMHSLLSTTCTHCSVPHALTAQYHMYSLLSTTYNHCSVPHVLTAQYHMHSLPIVLTFSECSFPSLVEHHGFIDVCNVVQHDRELANLVECYTLLW